MLTIALSGSLLSTRITDLHVLGTFKLLGYERV